VRARGLLERKASSHVHAAASALDCSGCVTPGDLVRLVLRSALEGKQPAELCLDRCAVLAGLTQQPEHLTVIFADGADPSRRPATASAALVAAWIARLVATMERPASSSLLAAARYSSALAT
jgi:class 3 adenylate cyclase